MTTCGICGTRFDERRYQVVVRELRASFDTVQCAETALRNKRREDGRHAARSAIGVGQPLLALPPGDPAADASRASGVTAPAGAP
jgi:hypothetical protein